MKILNLTIEKNMLLDNDAEFVFTDKNLIYSKKNARGKTSLLRLLLYSLGYDVPATKGLKKFNNITTTVTIENGSNNYRITRRFYHVVLEQNNESEDYFLPQDTAKLQGKIFSIEDRQLIDNLLGAFYIDQDKGWTLLNRGKVVGNIRFNVEDFISGISGVSTYDIKEKIKLADRKIAKYQAMRSLADFQDLANGEVEIPESEKSTNRLVNERNLAQQELREAEAELAELRAIQKENDELPKLIEKYSIQVNVDGKTYPITRDNICNYVENEEYLCSAIRQKRSKIAQIKKTIDKTDQEVNKRRTLFDTKSTLEEIEEKLLNIQVSRDAIENALNEARSLKRRNNEELRNLITNNNSVDFLDSVIRKYAKELGVSYYIDDGRNFLVTSELKKYSGKVLFQITYIFKLAYIALVSERCGVVLPIIIDSPRSGEILKDASDAMLGIIRRDFSEHQLIVASVFDDYESLKHCNKIELNNGVFGTLPE